jgi:hypothetical protein
MANALMSLLGMGGKGMAEKTADTLVDTNAYRKYVIDTQTNGEEPMSKEEWARSRGNG